MGRGRTVEELSSAIQTSRRGKGSLQKSEMADEVAQCAIA